jgi:hypothetical protein
MLSRQTSAIDEIFFFAAFTLFGHIFFQPSLFRQVFID